VSATSARAHSKIPAFVTVRDRVSDLKLLVAWLEDAGIESITLLDCASTYPPCLDYLANQGDRVKRLPNLGHLALFAADLAPSTPFILSDPDVVPLGPPSGIEYLWDLAQRYPAYKVGMGLDLEGATMPAQVMAHEQQFWNEGRLLEPGVYGAPIDTTLAIWTPSLVGLGYFNGIRTGPPHVLRHSSYFTDYQHPETFSEEDRYYLAHAEGNASGWKYDIERYG
jgi:hypothetical protein